jgi:hypothetical protein
MANELAEKIIQREEKLRLERFNWNQTLQEVSELVLPNRAAFTTTINPADNTHHKVFDTTAIWANEQLAAGLHGFVTPSTQRWLKMDLNNEELMEDDEVVNWLAMASDVAYKYIYQPNSNFVSMSHEMYLDLGCLGTSVMYIEERPSRLSPLRFHTFHLAECVFDEDAEGQVNTLYRKFKWSVRKIVEKFPDTAPKKLHEMVEKGQNEEMEIILCVKPTEDSKKQALGFAFDSVYVLVAEKVILSDKAFYEFPFAVPRWSKLSGEKMGRSPAMNCLYDIRMINEMSKTVLKSAQKIVDPPLMLPDEGFLMPIKTTPGGLNYYEAGREDRIEPLQTGGDVGLGLEMMNQRREQILRAFYLDSMKLQKENKEMTAYEAAQRTEENMRAMSPMVSRLQNEALDRIIGRTISILGRLQLLPPAPKQIQGLDYRVEYMSPVTRALKMAGMTGIQRMIQVVAPFMEIKPDAADKIDVDQIIDYAASTLDVPVKLIRTDKEVGEIRQQRATEQQKQAEAEQAEVMAGAAQKGGKAMESMAKVKEMSGGGI